VVEIGAGEALFQQPLHPYTRALLSSVPALDPEHRTEQAPLAGDPPNPIDPPPGCRFHTRCAHAQPLCSMREPRLVAPAGLHPVACLMHMPGSGHSAALALEDKAPA
jgi:peptide/nickel transport system ATP-binding protein